MRDRIIGGMLGLACGDALGAPAEFKTLEEVQATWGVLTEMTGGGCWAPGEWTDDTALALAVAEGILDNPDDPVASVGARFLEWYHGHPKDIGTTIGAALSAYAGDWADASRSTPSARAGRAAANGSLMRTLPVALAYADRHEMLKASARISAMTHWDPQAEVCCAVYCLWVQALLCGVERLAAWEAALGAAQALAAQGRMSDDTPGPAGLPSGFWDRLASIPAKRCDQLQPTGYAAYVVDCLEAAVWCCLNAASLEEAIVSAVNLAGEADTIAAVAGGAAGVIWGRGAVPGRWLAKLHERERVTAAGERLADLRAGRAAGPA
jgi:ADP-ribosyl-[dinitrogen reductase] hydrolase